MKKTKSQTTKPPKPATATQARSNADRLSEVQRELEGLRADKRAAEEAQAAPINAIARLEAEAETLRRATAEEANREAHAQLDLAESSAQRSLAALDRCVSDLVRAIGPHAENIEAANAVRRSLGYDTSARTRAALYGALVRYGLLDPADLTQSLHSLQALDPHTQREAKAREARQAEAHAAREKERDEDPANIIDYTRRHLIAGALRGHAQSYRLHSQRSVLVKIEADLVAIRTQAARLPQEDREQIESEAAQLVRGIPVASNVEVAA